MTVPAFRTFCVVTLLAVPLSAADNSVQRDASPKEPNQFNEATVAQLQAQMAAGTLTSEQLTLYYIARIFDLDQGGPGVNAIPLGSSSDAPATSPGPSFRKQDRESRLSFVGH